MNIFFEKLVGNKQQEILRHRILNISILAAIILKVLSLFLDVSLNVQWQAIAFSAFSLLYFIIFYVIAHYSKNYDRLILFLISGVFILLTPLSWFANEGLAGNTIYSFFIAVVATFTLTLGKRRFQLLGLSIISLISVLIFEYFFPEYVVNYPKRDDKFIEIGFTSVISLMILIFYLNVYYHEYKKTFEELKESNQRLLIAQEESKKQQRRIQEQNTELSNRAADLEKANKTKDRFYTIIAHDLKSPFNTIIGFSDLIKEAAANNNYNQIKNYSKFLTESSEQAYKLLLNLLEWSRVQSMNIEYQPERIDLKKLIEEQINIYRYTAIAKNNHIETNLEKCFVFADKNMLETIIRNLISNAIKYTENGTIKIKSCYHEDDCLIKIEDTGLGIDPKLLKYIFHSPKTLPGTKGEKGSGIGLKLCKEFVETNKGKLDVISQPGKGSTFSFTLPVATIKESQNVS